MANSRERRKYDPVATRAAIVDAAIELFGRKGFHATAVSELVEAAGLTKGAFYHHFASKEEVLHLIHDSFIDRFLQEERAILDMDGTAHRRLYALVGLTARLVGDFLAEAQVFFGVDPASFGGSLQKRDAAFATYRAVISDGVAAGEFRADVDVDAATLGVLGMCNWMFMWYRPDGPLDASAIGADFGALILRGLTAKPSLAARIIGPSRAGM